MVLALAKADVVLVGEQHDDPNTHRLELAVLEGLLRRRVSLVVGLEMFERDVQPALDRYLAGSITEEQFLHDARPWPRYGTDYRPMVEFARVHGIPVIGSEVPRRIAGDVSKNGLAPLVGVMVTQRPSCSSGGSCPSSFNAGRVEGALESAEPAAAGSERSGAGFQGSRSRRGVAARWRAAAVGATPPQAAVRVAKRDRRHSQALVALR